MRLNLRRQIFLDPKSNLNSSGDHHERADMPCSYWSAGKRLADRFKRVGPSPTFLECELLWHAFQCVGLIPQSSP